MRENITPEEKLLRLIRGKKKEPPLNEAAPAPNEARQAAVKYWPRLKIDARAIITALFIISCLYFAASFVYPWFGARDIKRSISTQEEMPEQKAEPEQQIKPYEFYLEAARSRQVFVGPSDAGGAPAASLPAEADAISDINLVGIISDDNPQAIIEDKKSQKTYYLSEGQSIGAFRIEDIQEGKVILSNTAGRFELRL